MDSLKKLRAYRETYTPDLKFLVDAYEGNSTKLLKLMFAKNTSDAESVIRNDMEDIKGDFLVMYLDQKFNDGVTDIDYFTKVINGIKDIDLFGEIFFDRLNFKADHFDKIIENLAYPNHDCWGEGCIPLKANVKYSDDLICDLGVKWTRNGWSAAIVYGEHPSKYMSGDCFWMSQPCYKDTFIEALNIGIFNEDDVLNVLRDNKLLIPLMKSNKTHWDIKKYLES